MSYCFDMRRNARSSSRNPGQNEAVIAVEHAGDRRPSIAARLCTHTAVQQLLNQATAAKLSPRQHGLLHGPLVISNALY